MKKFFVLGLVAVALSAGLMLAGCKNKDCPGDGKCKYSTTGVSFCDNFAKSDGSLIGNKCFGSSVKVGQKCGC